MVFWFMKLISYSHWQKLKGDSVLVPKGKRGFKIRVFKIILKIFKKYFKLFFRFNTLARASSSGLTIGSAQSTFGRGLPKGAIKRSCIFFLNSHAWMCVAKSTNMKPRLTQCEGAEALSFLCSPLGEGMDVCGASPMVWEPGCRRPPKEECRLAPDSPSIISAS